MLLRRHLALPVMISAVIYLLTLHFGWQPHSYPDGEAWYFNPLAWQFLFVIGATAGYAPYSRQVLTMPSAWLTKLAIGITVPVAIIHISWTIHGAYEAFPGLLLQELSPLVDDKANLTPLRLASFLALAFTAGHLVRRNNRLLHTPVARLIIRCGQHSLQVFCLGQPGAGIFKANAALVGSPRMWTLAFGRTPTHGYAATREAAMRAVAKSWRRE